MARTLLVSPEQIQAGSITRTLLNTTTAASAVIAKVLVSSGISITSTGVDSGTGDVTLGLGNITPTSVVSTGPVTATTHGSAVIAKGVVGATSTIDWTQSSLQTATLTAATTTTFTFTAPLIVGCFVTLRVAQAATPSGVIVWPSTVLFYPTAIQQATPQSPTTVTEFLMYWDGTNYSVIKSVVQSSGLFNVDNAFLYAGNNLSSGLNFGKINGPSGGGAYIGWNVAGGQEMDFVNQSAGGMFGWNWYKSDGTTLTTVATLSAAGGLGVSSVLLSPGVAFPGAALASNGYTYSSSSLGFVLYGNGTTNDVTIANRAGTSAITVAANTVNVNMPGTLTVTGIATIPNIIGTVFNLGTVTTAAAINWATGGATQAVTLTNASACTFTFTAPLGPCELTLRVLGPATGTSGALTMPTVKGAALLTTAIATAKQSIYMIYYDGTNYWVQGQQTGV